MSRNETKDPDGEIIPPELAVRAMRDSGYRNTASALAELIDNSVQANAKRVDLICVEAMQRVSARDSRRIQSIAVLDNGSGMAPDVLRVALQFGNGTHLADRSGIGRFGMGLPNSSISQCRRVDVWTWQSGPENAIHAYLDVDAIDSGKMKRVPAPNANPVPKEWRSRSDNFKTKGTLVVWTNFDEHRLSWRGATATLSNTEKIVGRLYRKFIDSGKLQIRLLAYDETGKRDDQFARVNDPLYLMKDSTTPAPFDKEPMFQKWGEADEPFLIEYDGKTHTVYIRMSWARPETLPDDATNRGDKPYGKHAAKNLGVSIVRASRELDLDRGWTNSYDPTERWWGAEIEFPPALDEIFGVTNNKQSATIFSQMAQFDWKTEAEPNETASAFNERLKAEGDPRAFLIPIVNHLKEQIGQVRKRLEKQAEGRRSKDKRHEKPGSEDKATAKFKQRAEEGHETEQDKEEFSEKDKDALVDNLVNDKHYDRSVAEKIADATLTRKRRVTFVTKAMDGYAFFNVEHLQGGLTQIVFNTNHPAYKNLLETLEPNTENETDAQLLVRVHRAADTVEMLFAAWARYEMEEVRQKDKLFEMRQEWGKMARFFLSDAEE
jgi:hypothetical protein